MRTNVVNSKPDHKEKLMRALRITVAAVALAAALSPAVRGQDTAETRRLTILTFSAPVQLPGVTLPAGKYRFEMADINNAAHTVRVLSEDGQKVLGTFHTMPSTIPQRDLNTQDTLVMFSERPAGTPQAAREWFYPGRSSGEEFVYPKEQALAIAKANCTSVAAEEDGKFSRVEDCQKTAATTPASAAADTAQTATRESAEQTTARAEVETAAAAPAREEARAEVATPPAAPAPAAAPRGEARAEVGTAGRVEPAQPAGTSGRVESQAPAQSASPAPRELPRTASPLGVMVMLSILLIVAAIGVHHLRRAVVRG
jgi:hypothetical protein